MADPASAIVRLRPPHPPPPDATTEILLMAFAGAALAVVAALAISAWRARRRPLRRRALAELAATRALPDAERVAAQARLLRDVARACDEGAAKLFGDPWLTRLDALFATRFFTRGAGRAFGDALYRPGDAPAAALDAGLSRLLAGLKR
jgi:hypothetical protein